MKFALQILTIFSCIFVGYWIFNENSSSNAVGFSTYSAVVISKEEVFSRNGNLELNLNVKCYKIEELLSIPKRECQFTPSHSTQVDDGSCVLYVLDPNYIVSQQVCVLNKWETTEERMKMTPKEIGRRVKPFPLWKKVAGISGVVYNIIKSYRDGGVRKIFYYATVQTVSCVLTFNSSEEEEWSIMSLLDPVSAMARQICYFREWDGIKQIQKAKKQRMVETKEDVMIAKVVRIVKTGVSAGAVTYNLYNLCREGGMVRKIFNFFANRL
jgi:hypothetical protein